MEQPTVEYGEEFQRELSHEARPADMQAANSIGTSLVGSAVDTQQPAANSPDPQTDSAIQSILEPPAAATAHHHQSSDAAARWQRCATRPVDRPRHRRPRHHCRADSALNFKLQNQGFVVGE